MLDPDITQAAWEAGSAVFCLLDVRAIRQSKTLAGAHWLPKFYFGGWGIYNLWFYTALNLPWAYWAGLAITIVNFIWLGHVAYYASIDATRNIRSRIATRWQAFKAWAVLDDPLE